MTQYPSVGNVSRLSCLYTASDGVTPADPTVATVVVKPPVGISTTSTPVRDGVGLYHYDLLLNAVGDWYYHFIGTGAVVAQTDDGHIVVPPSFN
jgi:hypothetical protein